MMLLYSYFRSSAAYRVRIALNLKGIDYQQLPVNLVAGDQKSAEYLELNPQGLVPALRLESGEVIAQSTAILEWLEEAYPAKSLLPENAYGRASARAMVNGIACDIHPLNNLRVLKYLSAELRVSDEEKNNWYCHWIHEGFTSLEKQIKAAPYALGESVSLVDVYLVPQVFNALRFKVDLSSYPKIQAVYKACNTLDAFVQAAPENQPDAT